MIRTKAALMPLTAGAVVALAGCSLLPSVGPQPTPTPTAMSIAEAREVYAEAICGFNTGAREFDVTWTNLDAPLRDVQEAAALNLTDAETAKRMLDEAAWPEQVADDVATLADHLGVRAAKLGAVLDAEIIDEVNVIELTTPEDVGAAADRVESELGVTGELCPDAPAPEPEPEPEPEEPELLYAAELVGTAWSGTSDDGAYTEVYFNDDQSQTVTIVRDGVAYESSGFDVADNAVSFDVTGPDGEVFDMYGEWQAVEKVRLQGKPRAGGIIWTVDLQPLS